MEHDIRPWGEYWVLEDADSHKVKRIQVNPGGRLSLQYHHHRAEVWTIVSGIGTITINEETKKATRKAIDRIYRETIDLNLKTKKFLDELKLF